MYITSIVATSVLAGLASAHGGIPGAPKLFGRNAVAELRARNVFNAPRAAALVGAEEIATSMLPRPAGEKRQVGGVDGRCGAGIASCAKGYCCSLAGWCGTGKDYCAAPDCQFRYGPGCDANAIPPGTNTSSIARTALGSVQYGAGGIYDCVTPGTVAITYDDGPYIYTNDVLDILKKYNATATFFITGNNIGKGEIDNSAYGWDTIIKRTYAEGHQIASHTWSHQNLSQITSAERKDQMYKNEMALRNILGFFPTYMRPPYSACDQPSGCWRDMKTLGYHVTYFDVDTDDYNNDSPTLIQNAKNNYDAAMAGGNPSTNQYLVIGHDIHEQTVHNLTEYMLQQLNAQGYRAVTVGECLGDPVANWYRQSSGSVFTSATGPVTVASTTTLPVNSKTTTTSVAVTPTAVSQDATCGGTSGQTCLGSTFGNCCSVNGWCGSTSDYCADGCQVQFGTCSNTTGSVSNSPISAQSSPSTSTGSGSASAPTGSTQVSPDGTCGGTSKYTCLGSAKGDCCSQFGFCGSTTDYCGTGCNSAFGFCGNQVFSSISSKAAVASSSAKGASSLTPSAVVSSNAPVGSVSVSSVKAVVSSASASASGVTKITSTTISSSVKAVVSSASASASGVTKITSTTTSTVKSTVASASSSANASSTKSSSAPTSTALVTSNNGKCGAAVGQTCQGSPYGGCCGQDNYCGSFFACANGCQNKYGSCWFS